jgi:hypothetical protein
MTRAARLLCLVLIVVLNRAAPAHANPWDWIEALDGPGPSRSRGNLMANIFCSDSTPNRYTKRIFEIPRDPDLQSTCLFVDVRRFHADEDDRFYPVDLTITEFGSSVRFHRALEMGVGVGWMSFSSHYPGKDDDEIEGTRMTISFPRLVFKPLLMSKGWGRNADLGFIQMYVRESIIVGGLDQDDFATKPGHDFSRRHQRVLSMGFIVDAPSAVRLVKSAF